MKPLLFLLVSLGLWSACSPRKFHHYDARRGVHTFTKIEAYYRHPALITRGALRITPDSIQFVLGALDAARRAELDSQSAVWSRSERGQRRFRRWITDRGYPLQELVGAYPMDLLGGDPNRQPVHRGARIPFLDDYSVLRLRFHDDRESFTIFHWRTSVLQRIRKVLTGFWHERLTSNEEPTSRRNP